MTTQGTPFVPTGLGVEELGCEVGKVKRKADSDYDKRVTEAEKTGLPANSLRQPILP